MEDRTDERSGRHENPRGTGSRAGGGETAAGPGAGARAQAATRNAERERRADERIARDITSKYPDALYRAVIQQCEWSRGCRIARAARIAAIAADAISIYQ